MRVEHSNTLEDIEWFILAYARSPIKHGSNPLLEMST